MADSLTFGGLRNPEWDISRRAFLKGIGAFAAGSTLVAAGADTFVNTLTPAAAPVMGRSTFAEYLGETFHVHPTGGNVVTLRLSEIGDLPAGRGEQLDRERCFSLLFYGPMDRPLSQGSYEFRQRRMGKFLLFIVPVAPDSTFRYYEAVFNRIAV